MDQWVIYLAGGLAVAGFAAMVAAVLFARRSRRNVTRALTDADALGRIKSEFVSMVSHELRTPLTAIAGFTDTLQTYWKELPPAEVDEFLKIISKESEHLFELVEDILVMPRLEAGRLPLNPELCDLSAIAHHVTDVMVTKGESATAAVAIPVGVEVFADRRRVQQILRNLVQNAAKYGGDQILVESTQVGNVTMVTVADNGLGISERDSELIFQQFEQLSKGDDRNAGGIGLGLPIARRLAQAMGGDVWYESRFPTGSRFCFTLPTIAELEEGEALVEVDGELAAPAGTPTQGESERIPSV